MKSIAPNTITPMSAVLVLLALALTDVMGSGLFEPMSRDELLSKLNSNDQLKPAQVEKLISKASPSTRLGRISVRDLVRLKEISIEHCHKKELDERRDTCETSTAGENVRRYCEDRNNELVAFCLARVEPIMRQNLIWIGAEARKELEFYRTGLRRQANGKEISEETVRTFEKEDKTLSDSFKAAARKHCLSVSEHFDSVNSILEHGKSKLEDETENHSLRDAFDLYKMCQVVLRSAN